jgi:dTDP-4-amino-4,6-dideoxygalactose transaminase
MRPSPPRLSRLVAELKAIEESGVFTNFGPVNARLEQSLTEKLFGGKGGCLTVNNATTGLMLAIREAALERKSEGYALMPSFTFAATAHAAVWAGLTPLFCDIDPLTWNSSAESEDLLLETFKGDIACIVPYGCFGNALDLNRYQRLAREQQIGVVIDAAASLGTLNSDGTAFGEGFPHAIVYSMHATKTFSTFEGGIVHCGDEARLDRLRSMANFGFNVERETKMPGLNAKLSEIGALLGLAKLEEFDSVSAHRGQLADAYRRQLPNFTFQKMVGRRIVYQFMPLLLPAPRRRHQVLDQLSKVGIEARHYFSPHLHEHPYFSSFPAAPLTETKRVAEQVLSLPMSDQMTLSDLGFVAQSLKSIMGDDFE